MINILQVLLLLDGHDEYKAGVNKEIDEVIQKDQLGHCCVVLTSRTSDQLRDVRDYMDLEVDILGFDNKTAEIYAGKYLGDATEAKTLMKQIHDIDTKNSKVGASLLEKNPSRLEALVQLPILLQMLCVLNQEEQSLPNTKGGIIDAIVDRTIKRTIKKTPGEKATMNTKAVLERLGKAAWEALNKNTQQLMISKVIILCPLFA